MVKKKKRTSITRKKIAEMSMQVIVMAVIALLVMVILIFIFKGQTGEVKKGFQGTIDTAKQGTDKVSKDLGGLFNDNGSDISSGLD